MPLRKWKCSHCSTEIKSFSKNPECPECSLGEMKKIIGSPEAKFMEKVDPFKNKSNMKDQQKILLERSRVHTRDHASDDLIQTNEAEIAKKNQWLVENSDGSLRKRKKIDDI